jgi:hypothetical protein
MRISGHRLNRIVRKLGFPLEEFLKTRGVWPRGPVEPAKVPTASIMS